MLFTQIIATSGRLSGKECNAPKKSAAGVRISSSGGKITKTVFAVVIYVFYFGAPQTKETITRPPRPSSTRSMFLLMTNKEKR